MPRSNLPFDAFDSDSGLTDSSPTDSSGLPASTALASDGWISFSPSGLADAIDAPWQPLATAASSPLTAAAPSLNGGAITPPADSGPIQSPVENHAGIAGGNFDPHGNTGSSGGPTPQAGDAGEPSFGVGRITFVQDEDVTPTVGPYTGPSGPDVPAFTGAGINVLQTTTNADGSTTEIVTFAGSGITFNNTFQAGLPQAYVNDALAAEQLIASNWTGTVTINESFTAQAPGLTGWLASNSFYVYGVSYTTLRGALGTLAAQEPGNTYLQQVVAHLPSADPSGGAGFELALPYARMLGLAASAQNPDDIVTLNTSYNWSYGQDVIDTLVHEITEGGMGRIGGLGDQNSLWSVMDLFRYNSSGVADYTDGRDGRATFFSYNGGATLSGLSFNNEYSGSTKVNGGDTADFTQLDIFGTGTPGETFTLSQTDIQIMEALGWAMAPPQQPDVRAYLNMSNLTAQAGSTINVDLWTDNFGSGASGASTTGLYLSTDANITTSDTLLTTRSVPMLASNGTAGWYDHQNFNVVLPSNLAPGVYYLGGLADYNNQVSESNESNNNWNQVQITVTASHTVVVGADGVSNFPDASIKSIEAPTITPVAATTPQGSLLSIQEDQSDLLHLGLSSAPPDTAHATTSDANGGVAATLPSNTPPGNSTGPTFPVGGWPGADLGHATALPDSQLLPQHNDFHLI
jgi:CARDB